MRFPKHKCGLFLEHNPQRNDYFSVEEWLINLGCNRPDGEFYTWENHADKEAAIKNDELWALQWYPETPIGFHAIAASTFEGLQRLIDKHIVEDSGNA